MTKTSEQGRAARWPRNQPRGNIEVFIVIAADEVGTLRFDDRDPTYEAVRAAASGDYFGFDRVQPAHAFGVAGWVHGNGHAEGLPRNLVGSLVMAALGYNPYPLAGPLVITGYDQEGYGRIRTIGPRELIPVLSAYAGILDALGLPAPDEAARYRQASLPGTEAADVFRSLVAALRDLPAPTLTARPVR